MRARSECLRVCQECVCASRACRFRPPSSAEPPDGLRRLARFRPKSGWVRQHVGRLRRKLGGVRSSLAWKRATFGSCDESWAACEHFGPESTKCLCLIASTASQSTNYGSALTRFGAGLSEFVFGVRLHLTCIGAGPERPELPEHEVELEKSVHSSCFRWADFAFQSNFEVTSKHPPHKFDQIWTELGSFPACSALDTPLRLLQHCSHKLPRSTVGATCTSWPAEIHQIRPHPSEFGPTSNWAGLENVWVGFDQVWLNHGQLGPWFLQKLGWNRPN